MCIQTGRRSSLGLTYSIINLLGFTRHRLEHRVGAKGIEVGTGEVESASLSDELQLEVRVEFEFSCKGLKDV